MNNLFGLSEFSIAVPIAVLLCSLVARKIFKVSFLAALAVVGAPLIAPLSEWPILHGFSDLPRSYLVGGVWVVMLCVGVAWNAIRPLIAAAVHSFGFLQLAYLGLLGGALLLATLLMVKPEPVITHFPGWKGSAGVILLAVSCVGVSRAVWRMLRASAFVVLWGGVALVLASSIFLDKLPQHIGRGDVAKFQGIVSSELVNGALDRLQMVTRHGIGVLGLLRVAQQQPIPRDHAEETRSIDA